MVGGATGMSFQGSSRTTVLNSDLRTSGLGPDRWRDLAEASVAALPRGDQGQGLANGQPKRLVVSQ